MPPKRPRKPNRPCPICLSDRYTGSLKANNTCRYFCAQCCIEFFITDTQIKIYDVLENGKTEYVNTIDLTTDEEYRQLYPIIPKQTWRSVNQPKRHYKTKNKKRPD